VADHRLTIIVLTYNRRDEVVRTVGHCLKLPDVDHVIVVDNASQDGTARVLKGCFPTVQILSSPVNVGAAGRNLGLAAATTPYVALCDDDTLWSPGAAGLCCEVLDAYPSVAVVCAQVVVGDERRLDPTSRIMAASPLGAGHLPGPRIVGFLAGASVVRRRAVTDAGGFSSRFFLGGEEELLAIDLAASGWDLIYLEDAVVQHYPSAHRDAPSRSIRTLRNALWTTWLRWPMVPAIKRTTELLLRAQSSGILGPVLAETLSGVPWVMANRRVVQEQLAANLTKVLARR
jgi:GT2 family glycosyltransferase